MTRTTTSAALATLLTALTLTACSTGDREAESTPTATASTPTPPPPTDVVEVQPGGPGEPSTTEVAGDEGGWNHDDIAFVQMMLPHHRQALDMAALAPDRASDERVLALAERIAQAQAPEILVLASLLAGQDVDVPQPGEDPGRYDHGEHGHHAMQGMLTTAQLADLADAEGSDFDRLFLKRMIAHHAGAVAMAADVRRTGSSRRVAELALDVEAGQAAEITRMEVVLASL
ncbi:DUF305 domain-containing protein [Nocardioides marmotae]|uniref:DUF305 domain-containing protein n=1 Tax=Nocardioides marmotae TaxID=2663857 RepID=UPI0012B64010|nr:DUF305 domain-containing protein [Nocardioides marmotae]MBC9733620.1 DUF305 domain-containing protein [Nocardioides marmotae]MTB84723.1 DUF305 domain-containing protein [Nocardioides marmotae]